MKWHVLLTIAALLPHWISAQPTKKTMTPNQNLYVTVRLDVQSDKLQIELLVDNRQGFDVYIPDVAFKSTPDGPKLDPAFLPVMLNRDNNVQVDLMVKPLDPNTLWATPPTFYTHVIKARSAYQRRWTIPYPIHISGKHNQGMGRMVPVSQDFLMNVGIVSVPTSYALKEVNIESEQLYQFRYDALPHQTIYPVVLRSRNLNVSVTDK